ncbi:SDR family oxidoreductase [Elioraea sp.]|uniref:SDR family oxidoreductase n=1 Tax=Elioraea sp. TaxID=2185103 RepID=UPI0025BE95A8|nr:SDR family oxidoreductase [Elioraea sp.]
MAYAAFDLTGRRALVTGATRGIGRAIAEALGAAGATVLVNGRNPAGVDLTVAALRALGIAAEPLAFDVTDAAAAEAAIAGAGRIDILVNNAGIQHRAPAVEFPDDAWDAIIDSHLTSVFRLIKRVAPQMLARRSGKIINLGSLLSELGRANIPAYGAAKGGVRMLTRCLATEFAPHNVQVNAIGPGYVRTEMNTALIENTGFNAWVCARTPAGRWAEPEEIAGAAVFLASDAASYVTGQILYVDGGVTASL